ncbi:adenosine deaminase [Nocardia sp. NPDC004568]|uniref:adenosine deaminase n=1 Tax=Nocardia sp. NPDC004568 TaxID=3154551 RepID=UPI0033A8488F
MEGPGAIHGIRPFARRFEIASAELSRSDRGFRPLSGSDDPARSSPARSNRRPDEDAGGGPGGAQLPRSGSADPYPKIELHVHLEGTIRPARLLDMARRNGVALPADNVEALSALYRYRDFDHFLEMWRTTTGAMRTEDDFRRAVLDYAREAKTHGVRYIEATFSPINRNKWDGIPYPAMFDGVTDGIAAAAEQYGVTVRAMPSLIWGVERDLAEECAQWAVRYRDRGIVGLDAGGNESARGDVSEFDRAVAIARAGGLGIVPHAGEAGGARAIRDVLRWNPDGLQHGIAAAGDPALMAELVDRGTVLRVTPTSNVATRVVADIAEHPLPRLREAGVRCSIGTDDPALFGTTLGQEYELAERLGISPAAAYRAGVDGSLCDDAVRQQLREVGDTAFGDSPG